MPEEQEDYTDYVRHLSNWISMFTMVCGFTFTSITILVTRLLDPISVGAQLTILFLMILFDLFRDIFLSLLLEGIRYCRYVPPLTKFATFRNHLT